MGNLCRNLALNVGFEAVLSEDVSPAAPRYQDALVCVSWCSRVAVMVTIKPITGGAPGPPSCGCGFITPSGQIVIMLYLCYHGNIKGPDGKGSVCVRGSLACCVHTVISGGHSVCVCVRVCVSVFCSCTIVCAVVPLK